MKNNIAPVAPPVKRRRIAGKDIVLNLTFQDSLIRFGILLFLPMLVLLVARHYVIYTAPVSAYLLMTALIEFCPIKYFWHRVIKHESDPVQPEYGKDPHYPDESI